MKIGYSCWGFLGDGIKDTPDGGRSHRFTLIKELMSQGSKIIMLQKNRDLIECNQDFSENNLSFNDDFPEIDAIFLEYRWQISGRNYQVDKSIPAYTSDFDRQSELINFYQDKNIPIIIWDKDQKMDDIDAQKMRNSVVFEPALKPKFDRKTLLFPVDDKKIKVALKELKKYKKQDKIFDLAYIGNQYERDASFREFVDYPASKINTKTPIFGNWNKYEEKYKKNLLDFPHVTFMGRLEFSKVHSSYEKSFSTALIAPERYYEAGQFTQRLFEAMWGLCIPFTPNKYDEIEKVILKDFIVDSGQELANKITEFKEKSDSEIKELFEKQFKMLDLFKPDKQVKVIMEAIKSYYEQISK